MRFVVTVGLGALGEVLPFVALASALRRRGHDVCFIGNPVLEDRARNGGLRFVPVGSLADHAALQADTSLFGRDRADGREILRRYALPLLDDYYRVAEGEMAASPTVLVTNEIGSAMAAEQHGRPVAAAILSPARLRSRYDPPHPERFLPGWTRWLAGSPTRMALTYRVKGLLKGRPAPRSSRPVVPPDSPVAQFRARVGLPPFARSAFRASLSLCLWPEWFGAPQKDWPEGAVICGFPSAALAATGSSDIDGLPLDRARPTVVATTGSLATSQGPFFATVAAACQALGWGAVLVTPHRDHVPSALPANVVHVTSAPFELLFRHATVVIHHGGIGTTAQALAAGVPQVISPLRGEQFDIGNRAVRLGVARMMPVARVGAPPLARTLEEMMRSARFTRECLRWKARLDEESNRLTGVEQLERLARERH